LAYPYAEGVGVFWGGDGKFSLAKRSLDGKELGPTLKDPLGKVLIQLPSTSITDRVKHDGHNVQWAGEPVWTLESGLGRVGTRLK
jgi:hypothetical protein